MNFMTVVKYSLTINTVKKNIHKNLLFSFNALSTVLIIIVVFM
jgi:hypothetical protein